MTNPANLSHQARPKNAIGYRLIPVALLILSSSPSTPCRANTDSVFSPDVQPNEKTLEYRASFESDEDDDTTAHRLHYQQSVNEKLRWRLIGQFTDSDGNTEYRYTRLELQQQFKTGNTSGFSSAVRYELQIADGDDKPSRARISLTGKTEFPDNWQLRANFRTGKQFDSGAKNGLLLESRWQGTRLLDSGHQVGLEMFNNWNTTADMGSFDEQKHTLGPIIKLNLGNQVNAEASYHAGLSKAASDNTFRLRLYLNYGL